VDEDPRRDCEGGRIDVVDISSQLDLNVVDYGDSCKESPLSLFNLEVLP
jgi:hypothetical protein